MKRVRPIENFQEIDTTTQIHTSELRPGLLESILWKKDFNFHKSQSTLFMMWQMPRLLSKRICQV